MHAVQELSPLGSTDFDYESFEDIVRPLLPKLSKPDSVKQLVEEIRHKEKAVKEMRIGFESLSVNPESLGDTIYEAITGQKNIGKVTCLDNPLATIIQVDSPADYKLLHNRKSGGFFQSEVNINEKYSGKKSLPEKPFSLIVLHNSEEEVKKHEIHHGINQVFIRVLKKIGNNKYWQQSIDYSWDKWGKWFEKNHPEEYGSLTENSRVPWYYSVWTSWIRVTKQRGGSISSYVNNELVPASLGRAKDEVIADFEATGNFDYIDELLKSDLDFSDALYDYVAEWFDASINWKALKVRLAII